MFNPEQQELIAKVITSDGKQATNIAMLSIADDNESLVIKFGDTTLGLKAIHAQQAINSVCAIRAKQLTEAQQKKAKAEE